MTSTTRSDRTPAAAEPTAQPPAPTPGRAGARAWVALVVLMLPVLLVSVDNTVLGFALPAITEALRPSSTQMLWIVDVYPLVLAGLLVAMGSLGDRIGRRTVLLIGATGFAAVSAAAAFAPTAELLIGARALLGVFGAMLMPSTLSLLRSVFQDREQRRVAIAIWAAGFAAGSALGPIVGGLLIEHFWWGSVFLLAVPVLIPLLVLTPLLVRESRDPAPGPVDVVSILLSLVTMAPIVYGIKEFAVHGLALVPVLAVLIGVSAGVLFVRRQLRRPVPMLDMRLFRRAAFSGAVLINLLSVIALVGFLFFVSQHLQLVLGMPPMRAGMVLLPGLATMIVSGLLVVPVARRLRPGLVIAGGLCVSAAGYIVVAVSGGDASWGVLLAAFVLLGLGIGAAETVSNELIVSTAPADKAGAASAVSETAYELGAVLGTATLGSIIIASYRAAIVLPAGLSPADATAAGDTLGGAVTVAGGLPRGVAAELLASARQAFDSGIALTASIGAGLMLTAAVLALVTLRRVRS
ncbi:MFS transporter [Microbacterium sp. X-17]|uniref:MFS transporter n=1 Tax=Microbacterium sp. X-17 TaxID=3144404 RepID=UPI0031F5B0F3